MKISYNWLKEYLPDLTLTPAEVAQAYTMHSFETQVSHTLAIPDGVKTVKITAIAPHPDADRLRLATITDGQTELTIVCGAPKIEVGQVVPYAPPGTIVQDSQGGELIIKEATIRGQTSPGMLASLAEMGLGSDAAGIWVLPADTPLNQPLSDLIPQDTILEAEITPNRAHDCLSMRGVARELAAILDLDIVEANIPELPVAKRAVGDWQLDISDTRLCPRYLAVILSDLSDTISPLWLQQRLLALGSRPMSALVDITNYVMFEIGNPSHAFDQSTLPGQTLGVRLAKQNETLTTLDTKQRQLTNSDVVITANDHPIALAGVMGGQATQITPETRQVILEVANFNAYRIQETSRTQNLASEASLRFSKALPADIVSEAAARAATLFEDITGARIQGVLDSRPESSGIKTVAFNPAQVAQVSGQAAGSEDAISQSLERLRFKVDTSRTPWTVSIPSDRLDITGSHDLVEEVIRLHGLENISAILPATQPAPIPPAIYWRETLRDLLAATGFTETMNHSFMPGSEAKLIDLPLDAALELSNPPAPELKYLRTSLLPGLIKNLKTNREALHRKGQHKERALFEVGLVFHKDKTATRVPGVRQTQHIVLAVVGNTQVLKTTLTAIEETLSLKALQTNASQLAFLEDGQELSLSKNGPALGYFGPLNPTVLKKLKYRLPIHVMELNLDAMFASAQPPQPAGMQEASQSDVTQYTSISKYPSVFRDIAFLLDARESISIEEIQGFISHTGGAIVLDVDLFDMFQAPDSDKQSLAFTIEYNDPSQTLTDTEVNEAHEKISHALQEEYDAQIR